MAHLERVIVLVDMDCFYCQVEEKLNPEIQGKPIAVVQYNAWKGGGIIAVNYPARDRGVTRHMRGAEAQKMCPEIILCPVPAVRGKADLTKFREAGKEVANVLHKFTELLQRASVDEAYLDITESVNKYLSENSNQISEADIPATYIYGWNKIDFLREIYENDTANLKLMAGAVIVEKIRAAVYEETGYRCSAGIAHNKILAKLVCGFNKPNKQTVLPHANVPNLYAELPVKKIKSLGGKFGESLSSDLGIKFMAELEKFSEKELQQRYDIKTGSWLYNIARGIDMEPVEVRICPKSIGCCKRFPGKNSLRTPEDVEHWFGELAEEISERLNQELSENNRKSKHVTVSYSLLKDKKNISFTKARTMLSYDPKKITLDALDVVTKANKLQEGKYLYPVTFLGFSAGKFEETGQNIKDFFAGVQKKNDEKTDESKISEEPLEDQETDLVLDEDKSYLSGTTSSKNYIFNGSFFEESPEPSTTKPEFNFKPFVPPPRSTQNKSDLKSYFKPSTIPERKTITSTSKTANTSTLKSFFQPTQLENTSETPINTEKEVVTQVNENLETSSEANIVAEHIDNSTTSEVRPSSKSFFLSIIAKRKEETIKSLQESNETVDNSKQDVEEEKVINIEEYCSECKRNIPESESLSHSDYHFALKMANEPIISTKATKINPKQKSPKSPVKCRSITFFTQKLPDESNSRICEQCQQRVLTESYMEHLDYHLAKNLHKMINDGEKINVKVAVKTDSVKITSKRKQHEDDAGTSKKAKSIVSFFKPKTGS